MLILGEIIQAWAGFLVLLIVWLTIAVIFAVLIRRRKIWRRYLFLLFFMLLGYFRMEEIQKISHIPTEDINQITGNVQKVVEKDGYFQLYVYDAVGFTKEGQRKLAGVILNVSDKNRKLCDEILAGDEILAVVSPKRYETARNPGNFDAKNYYETMNIVCFGWCEEITVLSKNKNPVTKGIFYWKDRLKTVYEQIAAKEDRGVYQSLVLGDKSELDATVKQLYQVNGIAHILAISGLHISILGMGLYRFLRKIYVPFPVSFLIGSFVMISYGIMTGNNVSTVRALVMFLACIFADVLGKSYDSISALALAAVLLLVSYPKLLWNTGFLLSFLAVIGVVVVKPALSAVFSKPEGKLFDGFLVSFSVSITTLPVLLCAYYETAVYSVFLNLIIIPLMTILMISVVFAGVAGLFSLTLGTFFVGTAHYILWFYQWICRIFRKLPGAVHVFGKPEPVLVTIYYLVLAVFVFAICSKKRRFNGAVFCGVVVVCMTCMTVHFHPDFYIRMLDVGQGDGIHIYAEGGHILIDGGSSDVKNVGEYRILPYLKSQGVRRIQYMVLTHADYDHYSGLLEIIEDSGITVDYILLSDVAVKSDSYKKVENTAKQAGISIKYVHGGTGFSCKNAVFTVLYPEKGIVCGDENDYSMVLQLSYKGFLALFTGDIGMQGEERMVNAGVLEDVHLLKVAHHGSRYSTGETFLQTVKPELALISCGEGNSYGHPHDELMGRLMEQNISIWQTPSSGAVTVTLDGGGIKVAPYGNS